MKCMVCGVETGDGIAICSACADIVTTAELELDRQERVLTEMVGVGELRSDEYERMITK